MAIIDGTNNAITTLNGTDGDDTFQLSMTNVANKTIYGGKGEDKLLIPSKSSDWSYSLLVSGKSSDHILTNNTTKQALTISSIENFEFLDKNMKFEEINKLGTEVAANNLLTGIGVFDKVVSELGIKISNLAKNASAKQVQKQIDAVNAKSLANDSYDKILDDALVSQLLKFDSVRKALLAEHDKNGDGKIQGIAELKSAKEALKTIVDSAQSPSGEVINITGDETEPLDASTKDITYNVTSGAVANNNGYIEFTVNAFGVGDKLSVPSGYVWEIDTGNSGDNQITLLASSEANSILVNLTAVPSDFDTIANNSVPAFNAYFGTSLNTTTGSTPSANVNISAAGTYALTSAADVVTVSAGNYDATLTGFAAGDKIDLPTAFLATLTLVNMPGDGKIELQADDGTNVINIILTGIPASTDASIYNMSTFYTAFGSGSIV